MTRSISNKEKLWRLVAVFGLLLLWQLLAMLLDEKLLLPSPLHVLKRLFELMGGVGFWSSLALSCGRIILGFLLGFVIGLVLAILAAQIHAVEIILSPLMSTVKAVPVASFIILALVWLKSAALPSFIAFLMVLPVVYTNILEGILGMDKKLAEWGHFYRLSFFKKLRYLWLPQLKSAIFSAAKLSGGLSWKAGIAAEVIAIPKGSIGENLYEAKIYLMTADLFAWTLALVLVSVLFEQLSLGLIRFFYKKQESA